MDMIGCGDVHQLDLGILGEDSPVGGVPLPAPAQGEWSEGGRVAGDDRDLPGLHGKLEELGDLAPRVAVGPAHEPLADQADSERTGHLRS